MAARAHEIFAEFDPVPVASASIAQVHFARLREEDGSHEVAVKILRPDMLAVIEHDLALMDNLAMLLEKLWPDGKRLKPREVVAEFAKYLKDELDLMREAANASQLRRNFTDSKLLIVPEVHWDFCTSTVMVMERMKGVPISQIDRLRNEGIDLKKLSEAGVEIFFTQVFRDGFFHADMHPGNIFVAADGRYIALDFGIVGTLTDSDKNYLAQNFLAFFRRDYKRVAEAHIESGWAPKDTRVDEFEAAIRAVCEPIFDRPLKDISFGKVLLRLFQTSRRFNVEIQPQLVMLQKTLLNIEGLGRQLDPELDLWQTAKPFLERWMSEQIGWRGLLRTFKQEAPYLARTLPQLPRLAHQQLAQPPRVDLQPQLAALIAAQNRQNRWLAVIALMLALLLGEPLPVSNDGRHPHHLQRGGCRRLVRHPRHQQGQALCSTWSATWKSRATSSAPWCRAPPRSRTRPGLPQPGPERRNGYRQPLHLPGRPPLQARRRRPAQGHRGAQPDRAHQPQHAVLVTDLRRTSLAVAKKKARPATARQQLFYVLKWTADKRQFGIEIRKGKYPESAEEWWKVDPRPGHAAAIRQRGRPRHPAPDSGLTAAMNPVCAPSVSARQTGPKSCSAWQPATGSIRRTTSACRSLPARCARPVSAGISMDRASSAPI